MIYIGLCLVSRYVLAKYSPIMPIENSWIPLTKKMIQAILGQPDVGSPKINVLTIIMIIKINAIKQNKIPMNADITNGVVEKDTIPSIAYLNSFQIDHLDSPAILSLFSYSNHLVL